MKKILKIILFLMFVVSLSVPVKAYAESYHKENIAVGVLDKDETARVITWSLQNFTISADFWEGYTLNDYVIASCTRITGFKNGKYEHGTITWDNPDYVIVLGPQDVTLTLKFKDGSTIPMTMQIEGKEAKVKKFVIPKEEVVTGPAISLTTSKLMLSAADTSYDININNKDDDATYSWTSSDPKIAKVNSKNGVVTAVADGKATITCTVTDKDGNKKDLQSTVTVGIDDNYPTLSDTELDLEVGDKQTISLENKTKGSTYKWKSSKKSVAKVLTNIGKVTAVSKGDADITCTVTTPDNEVIVLKCNVTVE